MTLNPLFLTAAFDPKQTMSIADAVPYGLKTALLGMGVIFSVLIILWAILAVFKFVFYKAPASENKAVKEEAKAETPVIVPEAPAASAGTDDAELVAVITAAIASMLDAPQTSFRVVSFRRTASK